MTFSDARHRSGPALFPSSTPATPPSPSSPPPPGTVFSVESGDTLTLAGPPRPNGPPLKKQITLSSLVAPKLVRGGERERAKWGR